MPEAVSDPINEVTPEAAEPEAVQAAEPVSPPAPPPRQFHSATISPGGAFQLKSFATIEELAAFVGKLPDGTVGCRFFGEPIPITTGAWRYLLYGGEYFPVFEQPKPLKIDRTPGGMGRENPNAKLSPRYADAIRDALAGEGDLPLTPEAMPGENEEGNRNGQFQPGVQGPAQAATSGTDATAAADGPGPATAAAVDSGVQWTSGPVAGPFGVNLPNGFADEGTE